MEALPILNPNRTAQAKVYAIVDRILTAKKRDPKTDTSKLEREIDQKVYALYGLTDAEIAIVEGREAGAKRPAAVAKPVKASAARQPRKSVMADDPGLA
jgi:hypothetical protein